MSHWLNMNLIEYRTILKQWLESLIPSNEERTRRQGIITDSSLLLQYIHLLFRYMHILSYYSKKANLTDSTDLWRNTQNCQKYWKIQDTIANIDILFLLFLFSRKTFWLWNLNHNNCHKVLLDRRAGWKTLTLTPSISCTHFIGWSMSFCIYTCFNYFRYLDSNHTVTESQYAN